MHANLFLELNKSVKYLKNTNTNPITFSYTKNNIICKICNFKGVPIVEFSGVIARLTCTKCQQRGRWRWWVKTRPVSCVFQFHLFGFFPPVPLSYYHSLDLLFGISRKSFSLFRQRPQNGLSLVRGPTLVWSNSISSASRKNTNSQNK